MKKHPKHYEMRQRKHQNDEKRQKKRWELLGNQTKGPQKRVWKIRLGRKKHARRQDQRDAVDRGAENNASRARVGEEERERRGPERDRGPKQPFS